MSTREEVEQPRRRARRVVEIGDSRQAGLGEPDEDAGGTGVQVVDLRRIGHARPQPG